MQATSYAALSCRLLRLGAYFGRSPLLHQQWPGLVNQINVRLWEHLMMTSHSPRHGPNVVTPPFAVPGSQVGGADQAIVLIIIGRPGTFSPFIWCTGQRTRPAKVCFKAQFLPSRYSPVRSWCFETLQKSNDSGVDYQASFLPNPNTSRRDYRLVARDYC